MSDYEFNKDPDAVLDYTIDWSDWLGSDTITASTWTVPAGITNDSDSNTTTKAIIWLSGGTAETTYECINHITTTGGREDDRTLIIHILSDYSPPAAKVVDDYCTLGDLKARLGVDDTDDDIGLMQVIDAVSRLIDKETKRRFYTTSSNESRYYSPKYADMLFLPDDVLSIAATGMQSDDDADGTVETTWASTDYDLLPYNASLDGKPYTHIEITSNGSYAFPVGKKTVMITGKFGYCTIANLPSLIREACLLQCERIWKRKDAPFGVAGTPELGMLRLQERLDPDVQVMLSPFKRILI